MVFRGHVIDSEYYEKVRRLSETLPANISVSFASYEKAASSADVYRHVDGLLLLSQYEGFGLPPMEAQGLGVPVVVSDIPVFRETLGPAPLSCRPLT